MTSANKLNDGSNSASVSVTDRLCIPDCRFCEAKDISMCGALKGEEINKISDISTNEKMSAKRIICSEGEEAEYIFNIRSGCVRLSKMLYDGRRQIVGFLFTGDLFGLASPNGYGYTAEAITDVDFCKFTRKELFKRFSDLPNLAEKVLDITQANLHLATDNMLLLGRKNAKEKLCSFLLYLHDKTKRLNDTSDQNIYVPMSRSDIADHLGLTIETVSRQFTILAKDGIISIHEKPIIVILDMDRLKLIASGE